MSRRLTKAAKELIAKYLPKSKFAGFLFSCPVCGKDHIKQMKTIFEFRGDGWGFTSYTHDANSAVCYECIVSEDPKVKASYTAWRREFEKKLSDAKYGRVKA